MNETSKVIGLAQVVANSEQQARENVIAFLELCKEQNFESIVILGLRDGGLYATQCGIDSKIETLGILHMAADAFLRN